MTRNEMLRFISSNQELAKLINATEGKSFTNVKSNVLTVYINQYNQSRTQQRCANEVDKVDMLKSAIITFLISLDQRGMLNELLSQIK